MAKERLEYEVAGIRKSKAFVPLEQYYDESDQETENEESEIPQPTPEETQAIDLPQPPATSILEPAQSPPQASQQQNLPNHNNRTLATTHQPKNPQHHKKTQVTRQIWLPKNLVKAQHGRNQIWIPRQHPQRETTNSLYLQDTKKRPTQSKKRNPPNSTHRYQVWVPCSLTDAKQNNTQMWIPKSLVSHRSITNPYPGYKQKKGRKEGKKMHKTTAIRSSTPTSATNRGTQEADLIKTNYQYTKGMATNFSNKVT